MLEIVEVASAAEEVTTTARLDAGLEHQQSFVHHLQSMCFREEGDPREVSCQRDLNRKVRVTSPRSDSEAEGLLLSSCSDSGS